MFTSEEYQKIMAELKRFLNCGIIEISDDKSEDEYISNIFIRPKKDGRVRLILNLKLFYSLYVEKCHFKMESLRSALNETRKDCCFACRPCQMLITRFKSESRIENFSDLSLTVLSISLPH